MNDLTPGFSAAAQSQSCFRAVLRALSRPGEIQTLTSQLSPPPKLSPAAAAILLTLADATTSVALPDSAQPWLAFHTGAKISPVEGADFVLATTRPALSTLRHGSDDEPEAGATLILEIPAFETGGTYRLTGPGIETATTIRLPLDASFIAEWRAMRHHAPRGIDILLCAGSSILGLPRGTSIEAV